MENLLLAFTAQKTADCVFKGTPLSQERFSGPWAALRLETRHPHSTDISVNAKQKNASMNAAPRD
jgi:hypothetical protein